MKIKSGDILLFKGEKGISKLIAWGTNSKYSHVAVCVSAEMNLAIEAMAGGVKARDIRMIEEPYDVYRIKDGHSYDLNSTISFLVSKLNLKYDYLGVFFLGFIKLMSKIGKPLKEAANKWQIDRDYFCSELCYKAFYHGGNLDIVPDTNEADVTSPGDISKSSVVEQIANSVEQIADSE